MFFTQFRMAATAAAFSLVSTFASAATLLNGDFETGSLSNWTVATTANGATQVQDVTIFNTAGVASSNAARFNVGRSGGQSINQGITLLQSFTATVAGLYNFSVDVAASRGGSGGQSLEGGTFRLFSGTTLLDTFVSGNLAQNATVRSSLSGTVTLAAGQSSFRLEILRSAGTNNNSPRQYVDNAVVIAPPPPPAVVPLPAGLPLLLIGIGGLAALGRRKSG